MNFYIIILFSLLFKINCVRNYLNPWKQSQPIDRLYVINKKIDFNMLGATNSIFYTTDGVEQYLHGYIEVQCTPSGLTMKYTKILKHEIIMDGIMVDLTLEKLIHILEDQETEYDQIFKVNWPQKACKIFAIDHFQKILKLRKNNWQ